MEIHTIRRPGHWQTFRERYCYSPWATLLTFVVGAVVCAVLFFLFRWGVWNAEWAADPAACAKADGACWGFVTEKWRLILFGRYPYEEQWRPGVAMALLLGMTVISAVPALWTRKGVRSLAVGWGVTLVVFFSLLSGGVAGLSPVSTDMWGGLPLTVLLTLFGMTLSVPLGIALAIGRRSHMPIVRLLATGYVELVRGVPLITVLFVAAFIFPLVMPSEVRIDAFWRITVAIVLFQAAYMAETVRGGLQTIPKGQFNAAYSLGLTKRQAYVSVILPQALVAVIPAFVNSLLSCFMDTSLVTVVSMYDLTGSLRLALGDAVWRNYFIEGYVFIAAVYFVSSFAMSRYSQWLEAISRAPNEAFRLSRCVKEVLWIRRIFAGSP